MNEEWLPVPGFEIAYEVSNFGNIRSIDRTLPSGRWGVCTRKGQKIKSKINNGYKVVGLRLNGKRTWFGIHQLVCLAFHGPRPTPDHEAAHFPDRDRANNNADNLRWATRLENHADRRVHLTTPTGEKNYFAKITESDALEIRRLYRRGRSYHPGNQIELSKRFGICPDYVRHIGSGSGWAHLASQDL